MQYWQERRLDEQKHRPDDNRTAFQKDRSRIIHAAAFRRLQAKTQIMGVGVNDYYRTRLTHSLEVAQIASGILGQLRGLYKDNDILPCRSLIETLALAHDIGHPPFGHGGEVALNYMMRDNGGFEGNGQTLRIVSKLEPYTKGHGMNLTRRTLLGFVKYPQFINTLWQIPNNDTERFINTERWLPAKGIYQDEQDVFDWLLAPLNPHDASEFVSFVRNSKGQGKTLYKTLDCSIMELADDIAYAVHDLEDAIATGMVSKEQWSEFAKAEIQPITHPWVANNLTRITEQLFSPQEYQLKEAIGELVNLFITQTRLTELQKFENPLLDANAVLNDALSQVLEALKRFIFNKVIRSPELKQIEFKGQGIVRDLFEAFSSNPFSLLPNSRQHDYKNALGSGANTHRVIADYISSMTDEYAIKMHARLFLSYNH